MGSSGNLKYWEIAGGGYTGSINLTSSAVVTGLQCGLIDIRDDTLFATLSIVNPSSGALTATAANFKVINGLTGVTQKAGLLWPGYGRYFSEITLTSTGHIYYYNKRKSWK